MKGFTVILKILGSGIFTGIVWFLGYLSAEANRAYGNNEQIIFLTILLFSFQVGMILFFFTPSRLTSKYLITIILIGLVYSLLIFGMGFIF